MSVNDPTKRPDPVAESTGNDRDPDVFDKAYVVKLRHENAALRIKYKIDLALQDGFHRNGIAKPKLLRAYMDSEGITAKLDHNAEDFAAQIDAAISSLVEVEPALRGAASAPHGSTITPGAGASQLPSQQIDHAQIAHMSPDEVNAALRAGKLDALLNRKR